MKAADREHQCPMRKGKTQPDYKVMRDTSWGWTIWIPNFLDSKDTSVRATVSQINHCPFCGVPLNDANSVAV